MNQPRVIDGESLLDALSAQAQVLGFSQIGIAHIDLSSAEAGLLQWLQAGFHGQMEYMAKHGVKRARPAELVPGTVSVITARMNYLPGQSPDHPWRAVEWQRLHQPEQAVVSLYARGRDYHKVVRSRLQQLASWLEAQVEGLHYRVFTDSAPVLEAELASRSGTGWRGKHTLILSRDAGSMFFLGEIFIDVALPLTPPSQAHCGTCQACIDICPTRAIVSPYKLDARRCISYLTIEHPGPIPLELRALMGNRIYGCDDCQLVCPWNKYAQRSALPDFDVRVGLDSSTLLQLWAWSEADFMRYTEGSAIRRIGHWRWRRNLIVALGNSLAQAKDAQQRQLISLALQPVLGEGDAVLQEHAHWALEQRPPN